MSSPASVSAFGVRDLTVVESGSPDGKAPTRSFAVSSAYYADGAPRRTASLTGLLFGRVPIADTAASGQPGGCR